MKSSDTYQLYYPEDLAVPYVLEGVKSDKPITLLYGWREAGKTTGVARTLLLDCLFEPHFRWIHARKHYRWIEGSTWQTLCDQAEDMRIQNHFIFNKNHFTIKNKYRQGNFLKAGSSDNPDKIRSTAELNGIWFEEMHDLTEKEFASMYGTLRTKIGRTIKLVGCFNNDKISQESFIYKNFFNPESPVYNDIERILVTHKNNPYIDQEATEKKLKLVCLGDDALYEALTAGKFIEEKRDLYYTAFNRNIVFKKGLKLDTRFPSVITCDFNYAPGTAILKQTIREKGGKIRFIKEIQAEGGTLVLAKEVKMYLDKIGWTGVVKVTGDSSGHKKTSSAGMKTDFDIIREVLNIPKSFINYDNRENMDHDLSRDLINACFYYEMIEIDQDGCPQLCIDLQIVKPVPGTNKFYKDREQFKMDALDAFRYGIHYEIKDMRDIKVLNAIFDQK